MGSSEKESPNGPTTKKTGEKMNNDLFINDHYHPEGALQIEMRVRERAKQLAMQAAEDRLEEANHRQKWTLPSFKIFLNVLSSLVAG
jgi:hypothetical protein